MDGVLVERGEYADYARMAARHYLAGRPAIPVLTLRAVVAGAGGERLAPGEARRVVGVLVVSMPTLNSAVREAARPGRYRTGDKRADARRVNEEIRTIARVIVDPRWRGAGVATGLVRAYLDGPLTVATEAVAMMGSVCPFFGRAGMEAYELARPAADCRLEAVLRGAGIESWQLLDPAVRRRVTRRRGVRRALGVWKRARGASVRRAPEGRVALEAGWRLAARPIGYWGESSR